MSLCNPCSKSKPVLACTTDLTIGTISGLTTTVFVYIQNHTTGFIKRYDVTSDGVGLVVITLSTNDVMPSHDYELWITLATATDTDDREDITIDSVVYTCVKPIFRRVYGTDNVLDFGSQTLRIV